MSDRRAEVRAVISDAYYEARNQGRTMEHAADTATEGVLRLVADLERELGIGEDS